MGYVGSECDGESLRGMVGEEDSGDRSFRDPLRLAELVIVRVDSVDCTTDGMVKPGDVRGWELGHVDADEKKE